MTSTIVGIKINLFAAILAIGVPVFGVLYTTSG